MNTRGHTLNQQSLNLSQLSLNHLLYFCFTFLICKNNCFVVDQAKTPSRVFSTLHRVSSMMSWRGQHRSFGLQWLAWADSAWKQRPACKTRKLMQEVVTKTLNWFVVFLVFFKIQATSPAVQWLRLGLPMQEVQVQYLVEKLRSYLPLSQNTKT